MTVTDFAARVAGVCATRGVSGGVGAISEIIAIVLPILMNLPCLRSKSPAEKQDWIEDHPVRARVHTISAIMDQDPGVRRREAGVMADRVLETGGGLSEAEFASVHASCMSA